VNSIRHLACIPAIATVLVVAACGGGSPSDQRPGASTGVTPTSGPDSFLLFPNPQVQADGSKQTNTVAYAEAYYSAIDPNNEKDTLAKWKAANKFDGTEITVVFGDGRDLGYGRRMTARMNPDKTLAFVVENYLIDPSGNSGYGAESLLINLDAAIVRDPKSLAFVNAIEFSPGPAGGEIFFAKFFNFNAVTGQRELTVDLDGRGEKAMPGPCITCHGGRGDALTPPDATGKRHFPLVENSSSRTRGDVQARLHPFEVDAFLFSSKVGFTRAEQEAQFKSMNMMVLCSYPLPAGSPTSDEDKCRRVTKPTENEWQGPAATMLKSFYGGDGMHNSVFKDNFLPESWQTSGQTTLYQNVIAPACRLCHLMRGTGAQSDIDFATFEKFKAYADPNRDDRIRAHVIDRGNMPLAKIVFDAFYAAKRDETLATFLETQGFSVRDASGAVLKPGRPVADPGPDRVVQQGVTRLSANGSLFSTTYAWSLVSGPNGATLVDGDTVQPRFNANSDGTYVLSLVTSNGSVQSDPKKVTLVVDSSLAPAPSTIRFADIKSALQTCTSCHAAGAPQLPPVFFTNSDRNGDGAVDPTDDAWFYAEVRGRINFSDIVASPLLRKPSDHHHGGLFQPGFDSTAAPGDNRRQTYDLFLNWILNGAPQ